MSFLTLLSIKFFPMASIWLGFSNSNMMGKGIVCIQVGASILAAAIILGKKHELNDVKRQSRRFLREFSRGNDVLEYFLKRHKVGTASVERMYASSCERLVTLLDPEARHAVIGGYVQTGDAALSPREVELVRGTCERILQEEVLRLEYGMSLLATIVSAAPMVGLLGTVWGVLDAFALMGGKGVVLLTEIAPAISAALVTTVVALLVAIPGAIFYNHLVARLRELVTNMESFADELMGRIACEYQGGGM